MTNASYVKITSSDNGTGNADVPRKPCKGCGSCCDAPDRCEHCGKCRNCGFKMVETNPFPFPNTPWTPVPNPGWPYPYIGDPLHPPYTVTCYSHC